MSPAAPGLLVALPDTPAGAGSLPWPSPASEPDIRLFGEVNDAMMREFMRQLDAVRRRPGPLLLELTTVGGDADIGRRIALEMRLLGRSRGERVAFLGKTVVYSAGVTVMSAFAPAERYLSSDAVLLIHERKMDKTLHFSGALRACEALARDVLAEIENGQRLERAGFEDLVRGTGLGIDELMRHARDANWYLTADEALRIGLVGGVL